MEKSKPRGERLRETVESQGMTESLEIDTEQGLKGQERALVIAFSAPGMWTISFVNLEM